MNNLLLQSNSVYKILQSITCLSIMFFYFTIDTKACGGYWEEDYYYYNLFDQTNIRSHSFYPFLRDHEYIFFEDAADSSKMHQGNLELWQELFPQWSVAELSEKVYGSDLKSLWGEEKGELAQAAYAYLTYAHDAHGYFHHQVAYSWDYKEILGYDNASKMLVEQAIYIDMGLPPFQNASNQQLKARYAYQIIRFFHYNGQFQEAVDFFENKVEGKFPENEIYYYILDQVGGCYYGIKDYEQAAYYFLQVFANSIDRKKSAFISYNLCTNNSAEGKSHFKNSKDTLDYFFLRSLRSFSDGYQELNKLYAHDPNSDKVELLFMRELNNLERKLLHKHIGLSNDQLPGKKDQVADPKPLYQFAQKMTNNKSIKNKNFWILSKAYMAFLKGDPALAQKMMSEVKGNTFAKQKKQLAEVYKIFTWDKITPERETYLTKLLAPVYDKDTSLSEDIQHNWLYIIQDHIGHVYYKNKQIPKAFLVHNTLDNLTKVNSMQLVDDLIAMNERTDLSAFEKLLLKSATGGQTQKGIRHALKIHKVYHHLQVGQIHEALEVMNNSPSLNRFQSDSKSISAKVFSNNTIECFNCPEEKVMVDSVYLAKIFDFIPSKLNTYTLVKSLCQLDTLTKDETEWKRKLSHYLLGNYYFNVSNTGYFRGLVAQQSLDNCCHYYYFPIHKDAATLMRQGKGYNLYNIDEYGTNFYNLASLGHQHYQKVLQYSTDDELNARTLYMMAKCELNAYYNEEEQMTEAAEKKIGFTNLKRKKSFKQLKAEYGHTKFNDFIIKECGFYRYYSNL